MLSALISSFICSRMLSIGPGVRSVVVAGLGCGGVVVAATTPPNWGSTVVIKFWYRFLYPFSFFRGETFYRKAFIRN